jgi:hypothetical protein
MRMFHAACAASQRPGRSPTRGSGVGAVADTIGVTGAGITAGAGGGGGGGLPRPAGAGGAIVSGAPAGTAAAGGAAAGGAADGGAAAGGAAGGGAGAGAAGGAAAGVVAGGDDFGPELAHAGTPNAPAANRTVASRPLISSNRSCLIGGFPASRSSL